MTAQCGDEALEAQIVRGLAICEFGDISRHHQTRGVVDSLQHQASHRIS